MRRIKTNSLGARVLSGFLSFLMIISACPVQAFAEDDYDVDSQATTVVVDENGVHASEEGNSDYEFVFEDEANKNENETTDANPVNEDTEDQKDTTVDTPPTNEESSENGTEDQTVVDDQAKPDTDTSEEAKDEIKEDAANVYEYKVTLPSDTKISEGDTFDVSAEVVATVTSGDKTSDVKYNFVFTTDSSDAEIITGDKSTSASIKFNKAGEFTVTGTMYVDDKEVASDEMTVTVEERPVVEFDHYFTDIDESLVETSDLLVKTSDRSVFTKNTNIVSNFDDVYIIECASVEEARFVYSYYVDKVDSISDLSKVISIATDENEEDVAELDNLNEGNDAIAQLNDAVEDTDSTDYSDYIALIDTGADADVNFSVVGDSTNDATGHGTRMLELIKSENPDAKVMSIKVFNGSKTDAASVYAGIKLAIENDVKIINLSLVGADVEKNAIVKEVIQEAIDKNITVVGAAGNYNLSATKFIPGCIKDVIVVGAATEDGEKRSNSNYDVDYYVVAESTSEATAIFTGMYSKGISEDSKLFDGDLTPTTDVDPVKPENPDKPTDVGKYPFAQGLAEALNSSYSVNEDGTVTVTVPAEEFFETAAEKKTTAMGGPTSVRFEEGATGSWTGTCSFSGSHGEGTASAFTAGSSGDNNLFYRIWKDLGSPNIYASCDRYWGNSTNSKNAKVMSNGTVNYRASVSGVTSIEGGSKLQITFDILYSDNNNFNNVEWKAHNTTWTWTTSKTTVRKTGIKKNGKIQYGEPGTDSYPNWGAKGKPHKEVITVRWTLYKSEDGGTKTKYKAGTVQDIIEKNFEDSNEWSAMENAIIRNAERDASNAAENDIVKQGEFNGYRANDIVVNESTKIATQKWWQADRHQLYRSAATAWEYNYVYLSITKNVTNTDLITGSYKIDGTRIEATCNGQPVTDINGNPVVFEPTEAGQTKVYTLWYKDYYNKEITCTETQVGFGYFYDNVSNRTDTHKVTSLSKDNPTKFTITNTPMRDPTNLAVRKVSDKTMGSDFNGDITALNAKYTITYYNVDTNGNKTGNAVRSWTMHTDEDGICKFGNVNCLDSGNPFYTPSKKALTWPVGYYEITETVVPVINNQPTGLYKSTKTYTAKVLPDGVNDSGNYHTARHVNSWLWDSTTVIWSRLDGRSVANTNYTINGVIAVNDTTFDQVENEEWYPFGLLKVDTDLDDVDNGSKGTPEGDASYAGAKYQLFYSDGSKNAADVFDVRYNNPNGSVTFKFGTATNTVTAYDGFGRRDDTTVSNLRPILDNNNNPVYITCDAKGYGETAYKFPYDDNYVLVEVQAPEGYSVNHHAYTVSLTDWGTVGSGDIARPDSVKLRDHNGQLHDVVKITEEQNHLDGAATDSVFRYGFGMYKDDSTNNYNKNHGNSQGDGSLNGIKFAVVNISGQHIVMRDKYDGTNINNGWVKIANGEDIAPNEIAAILTTHNDASGKDGYLCMNGLPYGKYKVYELRRDTALAPNMQFKLDGTSAFANDSYLFDSKNVFEFTLTDTTFTHLEEGYIAENKEFVDGFQGYKMDEDYLKVTEGNANANDIRFAVINRSNKSIEVLPTDMAQLATVDPNYATYVDYLPSTEEDTHEIKKNQVVAVLTTHNGPTNTAEGTHKGQPAEGYFAMYGLPYGTYEVVELRRDSDVHPGDNWTGVNGTSIYANDSFYWKNYSYTYYLGVGEDAGLADEHITATTALAAHNSPYGVVSDNQYQNQVFRDGFSFWKRDLVFKYTDNTPQGDSTWNGIRYAIVNRSDDNVKMFDKYTSMLPAADQPYVYIKDNVAIAPGQVCAIVTSHQKAGNEDTNGNMQGYVAMFGLPYGEYDIYELRADAAADATLVGSVYDEANTALYGTSEYANYLPYTHNMYGYTDTNNSTKNRPSMLWNNTVFKYTLTDTIDENGHDIHSQLYQANNLHQVDDADRGIFVDETVYGSIWIHKYDRETGKQENQGTNSLAGIQFAVVNRSKWSVSYPYDPDAENPEVYAPGEVIAVVETDEEGNVHLDHMCYGSYDVYELRINDSYCDHTFSYGNTVAPHDVFDVNAYKNSDTSNDPSVVKKYGNDERANEWYCWNESMKNVRVTDENFHLVEVDYTVTPQEGQAIRTQGQEHHHDYYDLPIRGDFKMIKVNQDGKIMPYVPFLLSLVKTDENGVPIQNADGSYDVIEEHIVVTDFNGEINTRDWTSRPVTRDNVNVLDGKNNGIDFVGTKEDLKRAATANVWFGNPDSYVDYEGTHFIKSRGSLLAGTYVLQELRRSEANGFMRDDIEKVPMGNEQYRYIYWNTEDFDMLSTKLDVVHDNQVIYGSDWDIAVNIPLYMKSEAIDTKSNTNSTLPDENGALADTVEFGNLNVTQRYGYKTYIYRVEEDGTRHLLKETDITTLDFTGPKYFDQATNKEYAQIKNADGTYTVVKNGSKLVLDSDGNFHLEGVPAEDSTFNEYNVLHDFKVMQNFSVDTSSCQEGESIRFRVELYKAAGASGWNLIKTHNDNLDEPTQTVGIIKFVTESTDKTTRTRVAGLGGYAYGEDGMPLVDNAATTGNLVYNADGEIVGYTLVDDKIVYKNLAHDHNYRFQAYLVDANGNPVYDIYGNECRTDLLALYIDKDLDKVLNGTDIIYNGGSTTMLQKSLEGPCNGEITFSDFGMMDWILPNNPNGTNSVFIKVDLYDARGPLLKSHNANMDEEDETLRWLQIETTAMSEDGDQGVLPNGRSWDDNGKMIKDDVVLRDVIHYSNLAEPINARVEGYVYLVGYNEDGSRFIDTNNGLDTPYVAHETKNFNLTGKDGNVEMRYTIKDSGQYAKRQLVVCERVYMDVDGHAGVHQDGKYVPEMYQTDGRIIDRYGNYTYTTVDNEKYILHDDGKTEVLIALHEDINDEMQTVSIPEIETHLVNKHEGTEYKVVSRTYADVTVYDTVTYRNLVVGKPWNVTAELMNQETRQPVLDADGNPVKATVTFTPTAENSTIDPVSKRAYGQVVVPITFKQVLTALDWESDPSWVCFETLRYGDKGHSDFKYAVHNNLYDERQTVHLPTFRTTITSTVTDGEDITTAANAKDRQILAAPNQVVTDTVEIKNVGLDTVIKSTLTDTDPTITDIIPSTFTLKIAAVDAKTGEPILDATGKQYTTTKKLVVSAKFNDDGTITAYVNDKASDAEVVYNQYNDGEKDWNVLLFGTDNQPLTTDIDLKLDATNLKGKTIAFHETLYFGETATDGAEVLVEDSNEHVEQIVTVPEIHTQAVNPETGDHLVTVSGNNAESDDWYLNTSDLTKFDWKINDSVSLNSITPDTDYTLVTVVMNKDTGKLVTNKSDGSVFVQYTDYHSPETSEGAITCDCGKTGCCGTIAVNDEKLIELNLNKTDARDGGTFVVYEYLVLGSGNKTYVPDITKSVPTDCYAYHNDIEDVEQTVVIPSIKTTILDSKTETHVVPLDEDATVTDTVSYKGLVEGKEYTMQCVLMDKTNGTPIKDNDGNIITKDVPFTAGENGKGEVLVTFTISKELLHKFEEVLDDNHLDVDKHVSAVGPVISQDEDGTIHESGETTVHVDDVTYNHTDARSEVGVSDGDVERVSHGTRIVAFERCLDENGRVMAIHGDIDDENQTILIPRVFTHLTDTCIGDHVSRWSETETITDTVTFVSLQADKEYEITGKLINVDTGEPVLDKNGNEITASKKFTPNKLPDTTVSISEGKLIASGSVDIDFVVDTKYLKGTHVVAFEDCYYNKIRVATHSDITDEWQWTFVPEIGTTAYGYVRSTSDHSEYRDKIVPYGTTAEIVDVVSYNKLLPGVWYEMSGTLMDKATGKALTDKDGKVITATTRFMPAETSGNVEVVFKFDTTGLEGKTLVVFEDCFYVGAKKDGTPNAEAVAEHKDIDDKDQTIYCPKIRTTVKDADGNTNVKLDGTKMQTVIDTVTYENLVPGKEYTVTGKLVFKKDYANSKEYEYVKDANGNIITASTTFTPDKPNGTVSVKFEFDASLTAGKKVVVFEDLYIQNVRVATHSDINDENQTFDTSLKLHVKLVKSDFDNHQYNLKNAEITIYEDKKCTKVVKDINGNDCVGTTNKNGEIEFIITTYDENKSFYAKETKAPFGYKICDEVIEIKGIAYHNGQAASKTDYIESTSEKESAGVCAINLKMFDKIIIIPPKTGDKLPILPIVLISLLGLLCVGAFFATRRKNTVTTDTDSSEDADVEDKEEVTDQIAGLMSEDIDGNAENDSDF